MISRFSLIGASSVEDFKKISLFANEMIVYAKETKNPELLRISEYGLLQAQSRIAALTSKPIVHQRQLQITSASAAA